MYTIKLATAKALQLFLQKSVKGLQGPPLLTAGPRAKLTGLQLQHVHSLRFYTLFDKKRHSEKTAGQNRFYDHK